MWCLTLAQSATLQPAWPDAMTPAAIRALRQSLSLTQQEFATLLSVRRETIVRWEKQGSRPQPGHAQRLADLAAGMDGKGATIVNTSPAEVR
jgi:DNA-binding transcriptional regulator YiaG